MSAKLDAADCHREGTMQSRPPPGQNPRENEDSETRENSMSAKSDIIGVRALERGLILLSWINSADGISPGELSRATDIPRPTVYRLLETLEELGYVSRSATDNRLRATNLVRLLSRGYNDRTKLAVAAGPELEKLSRQLVWPTDVLTHRDGTMIVHESTQGRSPLSLSQSMVGVGLPVLRTAAGRAYLAFCGEAERKAVLSYIKKLDQQEDVQYLAEPVVSRVVHDARQKGFAERSGEAFIPNSLSERTSSIAVPIMRDDHLLGVLNIVWITSALNMRKAVGEFLAPMQKAASNIAKAIDTSG